MVIYGIWTLKKKCPRSQDQKKLHSYSEKGEDFVFLAAGQHICIYIGDKDIMSMFLHS